MLPLLGVDYQVMLFPEDDCGKGFDGDSRSVILAFYGSKSSTLLFRVTRHHLRFETLYGIRLANKFENDAENKDRRVKPLLGHGHTAKRAIGFWFSLCAMRQTSGFSPCS
jgi:hypothetical protein